MIKKELVKMLLCCVIALLTTSVNASEWLGTTSTDWMDADNWDTAYAPDVSVMVHAYIQNENPSVLGLGDTGVANVTFVQSTTGVADLTIYGTLNQLSGPIAGNTVGMAGKITVDGGTVNTNWWRVANCGTGTLIMKNNATVNATGLLSVPSAYYNGTGYATIELESGIFNAGDIFMNDHGLIRIGDGKIVLAGDAQAKVAAYASWIVPIDSLKTIDVSYDGSFTTVQAIPEPATLALLGLGGLLLRKRK